MQDVTVRDRHWHEKCFVCVECKASLVDRPFAFMPHRDNALYCAKCYEKNPSICAACQKPFYLGNTATKHTHTHTHTHTTV